MLEMLIGNNEKTGFRGIFEKEITMPHGPMAYIAAAANGSTIYMYGGWVDDGDTVDNVTNISNKFFSYNANNDTFTNLVATPGRRAFANLIYHSGSLYLVGGRTDGGSTTNYPGMNKYVISTKVWTNQYTTANNTARMGACAFLNTQTPVRILTVGGAPYVLGITANRKELISYQIDGSFTGALQYTGALFNNVRYSSYVNIGDDCYVIGGIDANDVVSNQVKRYNTLTNVTTNMANCPIGSSRGSACVIKGKIYLFGGYIDNTTTTDAIYEYNPATNKWTLFGKLPYRLMSHTAITVGEKVFLIGGWKVGTGRTDKILVLR